MKKWILGTLCLLSCIGLMAQGRVSTRSYLLADFPDKVTKVVLSGDDFLCSALRQEVVTRWTASPFEFCTDMEYEALKQSSDYYFLAPLATRFKGEPEPGIVFLCLYKGETEIISLPLVAADGGNGRELVYVGPLVKAIQDYTLSAMESEKTAYTREAWFNANYTSQGRMMQIYMATDDVSVSVTDNQLQGFLDDDFHLCSTEEADERFLSYAFNTLVSYTVAPVDPTAGSYSYQLLFESGTGTLFYISRHRIRPKTLPGFVTDDLKWLSKRR